MLDEEVEADLGDPNNAGDDYEIVTNRVPYVDGSSYLRVEVGTTEFAPVP